MKAQSLTVHNVLLSLHYSRKAHTALSRPTWPERRTCMGSLVTLGIGEGWARGGGVWCANQVVQFLGDRHLLCAHTWYVELELAFRGHVASAQMFLVSLSICSIWLDFCFGSGDDDLHFLHHAGTGCFSGASSPLDVGQAVWNENCQWVAWELGVSVCRGPEMTEFSEPLMQVKINEDCWTLFPVHQCFKKLLLRILQSLGVHARSWMRSDHSSFTLKVASLYLVGIRAES